MVDLPSCIELSQLWSFERHYAPKNCCLMRCMLTIVTISRRNQFQGQVGESAHSQVENLYTQTGRRWSRSVLTGPPTKNDVGFVWELLTRMPRVNSDEWGSIMGLLFCYCYSIGDKSPWSTELGRVKFYILSWQLRTGNTRTGKRPEPKVWQIIEIYTKNSFRLFGITWNVKSLMRAELASLS